MSGRLSSILLCMSLLPGCGSSKPTPVPAPAANSPTVEPNTQTPRSAPQTSIALPVPTEMPREIAPVVMDRTKEAERVFQDFVAAYREPDPTRWDQRFAELLAFKGDVVPALKAALASSEATEREMASTIAAAVAHEAAGLKEALRERLDDTSDFVKVNCAAALAVINPEDPDVHTALISLLESTNESIVLTALSALGNCGPSATVAVPKIQALMERGNETIQQAAALALEQIVPKL